MSVQNFSFLATLEVAEAEKVVVVVVVGWVEHVASMANLNLWVRVAFS